MDIKEVTLYSSKGEGGVPDSAKIVVEGQEFLCRLINGKIKVVGEPPSYVRAWRNRAKAIAYARITDELKNGHLRKQMCQPGNTLAIQMKKCSG